MNKNIYIIRHCEAVGQSLDAPLTEKGFIQAEELSGFLSYIKVDRIISSPFLRATQTMNPLAENMNIEIEMDARLSERVLSSTFFPDWMDKLEATFMDMDLKYEGGESSNEAMNLINDIEEINQSFYTLFCPIKYTKGYCTNFLVFFVHSFLYFYNKEGKRSLNLAFSFFLF